MFTLIGCGHEVDFGASVVCSLFSRSGSLKRLLKDGAGQTRSKAALSEPMFIVEGIVFSPGSMREVICKHDVFEL